MFAEPKSHDRHNNITQTNKRQKYQSLYFMPYVHERYVPKHILPCDSNVTAPYFLQSIFYIRLALIILNFIFDSIIITRSTEFTGVG